MEQHNISALKKQIDSVFGEETLMIPGIDQEHIDQIKNSDEFIKYSEDQVFRWLIRGYLINAEIQGYLSQEKKNEYLLKAETVDGRKYLAAAILFVGVPFADSLAQVKYTEHTETADSATH